MALSFVRLNYDNLRGKTILSDKRPLFYLNGKILLPVAPFDDGQYDQRKSRSGYPERDCILK